MTMKQLIADGCKRMAGGCHAGQAAARADRSRDASAGPPATPRAAGHQPSAISHQHSLTRRDLLALGAGGLGALALGGRASAADPVAAGVRHHAAKATSVIFLFMPGGPSQIDLFDPKPEVTRRDGQKVSAEMLKGQRFPFLAKEPSLLASPFTFAKHGRIGADVSELLPFTAGVADELAIIRSMRTDLNVINHAPGQVFMNTGHDVLGRPSLGAWLSYGLGGPAGDLPRHVVLQSSEAFLEAGRELWGAGFLPGQHQGVELRASGDPVLYLADPAGVGRDDRRASVDLIKRLNDLHQLGVGDPEIATRSAAYDLAVRMQASMPELADLGNEPAHVLALYGLGAGTKSSPQQQGFARNCLLARRLVERGVPFVQIVHKGWDHHGTGGKTIDKQLPQRCREIDQGTAALLRDLRQRGLLDRTLVVWGGEFGRTPMSEQQGRTVKSKDLGRDHHVRAFTMWLAGGGTKPGIYGASDELGYEVVADPVHVHDLHATILHLMGFDHERLTWRFQGRDYRLTDVKGEVFRKVIR